MWWLWLLEVVVAVVVAQAQMVDPAQQVRLPLILVPAQANPAQANHLLQELPPAVVVAEATIQVPVDPVESLVLGVQAESVTLL
jgi:hypothetical protein